MKVCPNCGHSSEKDNFCPYCGNPMMEQFPFEEEKNESVCPKCGKPLKSGAEYCPNCAKDLSRDEFDTFFEDKGGREEELEEVFPSSGVSSDPGFKVCPKCGTRYNSLLSGCPSCDRTFTEPAKKHTDKYASDARTLGIASIVMAVIFPYLGFLLGLAGLKKYKKYPQSKKFFITAVVISVCWFVSAIFIAVLGDV